MSKEREAVAAYRTAMVGAGATEIRYSLATGRALALAKELPDADRRHPEKLAAAIIRCEAALTVQQPEEFEARLKYTRDVSEACDAFWDAFEGQDVDGVTIIRRRA